VLISVQVGEGQTTSSIRDLIGHFERVEQAKTGGQDNRIPSALYAAHADRNGLILHAFCKSKIKIIRARADTNSLYETN
jgi:hypothetical protein